MLIDVEVEGKMVLGGFYGCNEFEMAPKGQRSSFPLTKLCLAGTEWLIALKGTVF